MGYWGYQPYESIAEKKAKAYKKLKKLKRKNPNIKPIVIEGRTLAKTWWGKAWNQNLEKYADYTNRIGRGRSYVRHGSVLDLQIKSGQVIAQVAGSGSSVYTVHIRIKEIKKATWMQIRKKCEGQLDSLQELLAGKFPKTLEEIFTEKRQGLFPLPKEITFDCSCPDWAVMCKHVAASLYGIGARLDEDPELFFKLRNVKIKDLIGQTIISKANELLNQAKKKSQKSLEQTDLSDLFGIDLEGIPKTKQKKKNNSKPGKRTKNREPGAKVKQKAALKKKPADGVKVRETQLQKDTKKPTIRLLPSAPAKRKPSRKKQPKLKLFKRGLQPQIELVKKAILKAKKGISATEIEEKTGVERKRIYMLVYKLKQKGLVKNESHGVYIKR